MKTEAALHLFQYWNRLRNGRQAPPRADIEPYDIREVLGQTFILESEGQNGPLQFRLVGTTMSGLIGRPLLGSPFNALFQEQHCAVLSRLLRNCYQDKSVIVLGLDAITASQRQTILEILLLPLQNEQGGYRILGCMAPHHIQFWHGLEPVILLDLHSIRVIDPDREPLFLSNRPEMPLPPGLAPHDTHFQSDKHPATRPHVKLVVIQGGKNTSSQTILTKP